MVKNYYPVAVFAYKRIDTLEKCLSSLAACDGADKTTVNVYVDGAKGEQDRPGNEQVKSYLESFLPTAGFASYSVTCRESNVGIHANVIGGITDTLENSAACIVVEDDLVLAPDFLIYMDGALDFYADDKRYASISGYTYPLKQLRKYKHDVFTLGKGQSWGWATWADRWSQVDWDLRDFDDFKADRKAQKAFDRLQYELSDWIITQVDAGEEQWDWDFRWCYNIFRKGQLVVYPAKSRVRNEGFGGGGTHCFGDDSKFNAAFSKDYRECVYEKLPINRRLEKATAMYGVRTLKVKITDNLAKIFHVGEYRR